METDDWINSTIWDKAVTTDLLSSDDPIVFGADGTELGRASALVALRHSDHTLFLLVLLDTP